MAGEHGVILDELVAKNKVATAGLKLRGKRYPTYDIASPTLIASVKTHYGAGGAYTEEHIRAYVGDFGRMLGFNRAFEGCLSPLRQDAKLLIELSQLNLAPLPTEVTSGDGAKVAEYLASRSVLMVPDNQKDEIVEQLQQAYHEFDGEVLAQRVKGFGLTTYEVESIVGS